MRHHRGFLIFLLVGIFLFLWGAFAPAQATRFAGGDSVVIGPDEIVPDDLYVIAREVRIEGTVDGDVYVAAQRVTVGPNARVTGDLVAGAQIVDVQGIVEDDIRAAGYVVRVAGSRVGDDVVAAAFSVEVSDGTAVGGGLLVGAYQVLVAGNIREDVSVGANGIAINGTVGGNVTAIVGERGGPPPMFWAFFMTSRDVTIPAVPSGLTVAESATVGGDLVYQSVQEASIAPGAQIKGQIDHRLPPPPAEETKPPAFGTLPWALDQTRRGIGYLLVGIMLFLIAPMSSRRFAQRTGGKPLSALGWGVVAVAVLIAALLIVVLATAVLALLLSTLTLGVLARWVLILGLVTDAVLLVGYLAYVNLLAPVLVSYTAFHRLDRGGWLWIPPLVLGILLYTVVTSLPYAGWVFSLLVVLVAVGGAVIWYRERLR